MSERATEQLGRARAIYESLQQNGKLTVQELAEMHELPEEDVIAILDEHLVDEDGTIGHAGPGRGGGWAQSEQ